MTRPLTVRAHHLMCLVHHAAYHGEHPTLPALLSALRADPDRLVRVVAGPDDICEPCPFWKGGECARIEGLEAVNRAKDERFAALLAPFAARPLPARELYRLIARQVTREALRTVCADCEPDRCADALERPDFETVLFGKTVE